MCVAGGLRRVGDSVDVEMIRVGMVDEDKVMRMRVADSSSLHAVVFWVRAPCGDGGGVVWCGGVGCHVDVRDWVYVFLDWEQGVFGACSVEDGCVPGRLYGCVGGGWRCSVGGMAFCILVAR